MTLPLLVVAWLTGCKTAEEDDIGELSGEMSTQMNAARAQFHDSGATAQQMREFDKAMAEMEKAMRAMEKQLQRLEREMK